MKGYSYGISKSSFSFNFVNDTNEEHGWNDRDKWSHYSILHKLLNFMKTRGFSVGKDPRIEREYKSLSKDHWYGRQKDLEFKAKRYPRGFSIEFFQTINGNEYDSDKYDKAPYLIKLQWIKEMKHIENFIKETIPNIGCHTKIKYKSSEDKVKQHLIESWHKPQENTNFNLSDLDGTTVEEHYNNKDRDKKVLYNGQIKYFRDYRGRLKRGKIYHNINNMWWVILNDEDYTNMASFELFDATEEDFKIRRKQRNKKQAYETSTTAHRKKFNDSFTYKDLNRNDIEKLQELIGREIELYAKDNRCLESMKIHPKIRTRFNNKKLQHAFLYVDAHYFTKRECVSFNADGFIGFAGWSDSSNVRPILKGFNEWCDYLSYKNN